MHGPNPMKQTGPGLRMQNPAASILAPLLPFAKQQSYLNPKGPSFAPPSVPTVFLPSDPTPLPPGSFIPSCDFLLPQPFKQPGRFGHRNLRQIFPIPVPPTQARQTPSPCFAGIPWFFQGSPTFPAPVHPRPPKLFQSGKSSAPKTNTP